ncbi:PD-(D/E)XK nuclease family protein [Halolamina sediminis]|uniref:PD-(D/E)XK nuclease family protein n=1 Tax=Halolamina sediminis TaxID=1480675 RepID=UPI0006B5DB15|nr:PD-(D/E)XK nuclease family protein [Halolamina sediminis]
MDVIEYSLGSQQKAEVYINRLFAYFLDPDQPHGMEEEFLRAFLNGLPDTCGFDEDLHDLSDVVVDDQVRLTEQVDGDPVSSGFVDLVVQVPNEWFLLVELKFSAEDTQTEFYRQDVTHIDDVPKDDYESGAYYLYLHQADRPDANDSEFSNWTWTKFVDSVLTDFIVATAPRYPQRTVVQLYEFADDIRSIAGMSDPTDNVAEKVELYLDHYETITDVTETFEDQWETFAHNWPTRLANRLASNGSGAILSDTDYHVQFECPTDGVGNWWFRSTSSDWGMLFKHGWWRHTDDLTDIRHERPDDRNDARIGFHHRLENDRDQALRDNTLTLYFRNMGANDQSFIDAVYEKFNAQADAIDTVLPATANRTGNKRNMIAATYDITPDDHDDFFTAYIAALEDAFRDLVVENPELLSILDGIYADAVDDVYDTDITPPR